MTGQGNSKTPTLGFANGISLLRALNTELMRVMGRFVEQWTITVARLCFRSYSISLQLLLLVDRGGWKKY